MCLFSGNQQYSMHMAPHQLIQQQQQPMAMLPSGSQTQFTAASTHAGFVTTPSAITPPAMMLVQQQGQAPPTAAMYAPATPMQMAGVPMPQIGVGGQNPGGQEAQYSSFSLLAEGGGGVHYVEYPAANSLVVPPPYYSSDAAAADQIQ